MTVHSIKLTLLYALLLSCLVGIPFAEVIAAVGCPDLSWSDLTQTPGGRPEREGTPVGKRKSLHEYGPEDLHPGARENEPPVLRKRRATQPKSRHITPSTPGSFGAPTPTVIPTPTPIPPPAESPISSTVMTYSAPQDAKKSEALRQKLLVSSSIFLLLLMALGFFVIKMWRQLQADRQTAREVDTRERGARAGDLLIRPDEQAAAEKRVSSSEISHELLKSKMRNERLTRFKKA